MKKYKKYYQIDTRHKPILIHIKRIYKKYITKYTYKYEKKLPKKY